MWKLKEMQMKKGNKKNIVTSSVIAYIDGGIKERGLAVYKRCGTFDGI